MWRWIIEKMFWMREHWADMSTAILTLLALLLAIIPSRVAEIEKQWWKKTLVILAILVIGISGSIRGIDDKAKFEMQIRTLSSVALMEATKTDVQNMISHMDEGFNRVVRAIEMGKLPGKHLGTWPPTPVKPPIPVVQHLRFSERRMPSDKPESPYALQVVIQTDVEVERPVIEIEFSGPLDKGEFFVAGQAVLLMQRFQTSGNVMKLSFDFPKWIPDSPIVAGIWSRQEVHVVSIKNSRW